MSAEYDDVLTNQPVVIDNVRARAPPCGIMPRSPLTLTTRRANRAPGR